MTIDPRMSRQARERLHSEAVAITADLVAIDSTNTGEPRPSGTVRPGVPPIAEYLDEVGISSELVESVPGVAASSRASRALIRTPAAWWSTGMSMGPGDRRTGRSRRSPVKSVTGGSTGVEPLI